MNRVQINQLNMMDTVNQVLTTYNAVWSSNAAINAIVATYRSHLTALNANDTLQKTISTGVTQTKEQAKAAMVAAAILTANAGKAYAAVTGNTNLVAQMSHSKSEINAASDTDADDICQNIHDNLNPFIANVTAYGATAATQTNLQNAINAFSILIGQPRQQIGIVAHATITIAQHFSAVNALLKNQLDTILLQYQSSNAPFYNEYVNARIIVDIGHRHTVTLEGFIYDNHSHAITGATVTLSGSASHHKVTNATGEYKFTRLHTGSYTLTISATGFVTQTKTVNITQNETLHTDFTMVASSGGGTTTPTPVVSQ
jgi:hypothetical protein